MVPTCHNVPEEHVPELLVLAAEEPEEERQHNQRVDLGAVAHEDECLRRKVCNVCVSDFRMRERGTHV